MTIEELKLIVEVCMPDVPFKDWLCKRFLSNYGKIALKTRPNMEVRAKYIPKPSSNPKIALIRDLGRRNNWQEIDYQPWNKMISFLKEDIRLNYYYSTNTIGTALNHPVKGKTQLFRRNVTEKDLEKIFQNPRIHTDKGYYVKH